MPKSPKDAKDPVQELLDMLASKKQSGRTSGANTLDPADQQELDYLFERLEDYRKELGELDKEKKKLHKHLGNKLWD